MDRYVGWGRLDDGMEGKVGVGIGLGLVNGMNEWWSLLGVGVGVGRAM